MQEQDENWRERKTILQEFDYFIKSVIESDKLKPNKLFIEQLKTAFMAGSVSTWKNVLQQVHADDPAEFMNYLKSMENQIVKFAEKNGDPG